MLTGTMKRLSCVLFAVCALALPTLAQEQEEEDYNPVTPLEDPSDVQYILDELAAESGEVAGVYQLHPANTSSPRDTMVSFLKQTQRFYDLISSENYSPTERVEVFHIFGQMQDFFDLRNVAPSLRADYASASAIYLREIIDRVGLPPLEDIPDEKMMHDAIEEGFPARWQLPDMPFEIVRVEEGENAGHYVFSEETVTEVKPLFSEIRHMPYKSSAAKDFYYYFFLTPNPVIPAEWIEALPDWMHADFYEQTVWQWLSMFIVLILSALSVLLLYTLLHLLGKNLSSATRHALFLLTPAYTIVICYVAYDLIDDKIFITGDVFQVIIYLLSMVALFAAVIMTFMAGTLAADLVVKTERFRYRAFDSQLARIGIRITSIILCIAILARGMQFIGVPLATVIAGASVTGLAVALAAQSTLRNIFGSLMLLLDKPFRVGQRIKAHGHDGIVEEIGLRSTKIRLLNGHVTSIPNEHMADADIENVGMRPYIRRLFNVTITYGTPLPKVRRAVEIIREILAVPEGESSEDQDDRPGLLPESQEEFEETVKHPNEAIANEEFPPRVFFNEFNPDSLNIIVIYWYFPPNYWDFLEHAQTVNEEIMRRFEEEGIEFAFPTQTIHLANGEKAKNFPEIETETEARTSEQTPPGKSS